MMLETESDRLRSLYESGSHVGKAMDMHFRECRGKSSMLQITVSDIHLHCQMV